MWVQIRGGCGVATAKVFPILNPSYPGSGDEPGWASTWFNQVQPGSTRFNLVEKLLFLKTLNLVETSTNNQLYYPTWLRFFWTWLNLVEPGWEFTLDIWIKTSFNFTILNKYSLKFRSRRQLRIHPGYPQNISAFKTNFSHKMAENHIFDLVLRSETCGIPGSNF